MKQQKAQPRKKANLYGEYCNVTDVEREALTIKLFATREIWCNLNDGRFIRQFDVEKNPTIKSISVLYPRIRNVESGGCIIAKRERPEGALKFLKDPIPIQKKKRFRARKLEQAVYK